MHSQLLSAAEEAVGLERNARAFAEVVSKRLENELMVQSKYLLKKIGINQVIVSRFCISCFRITII